MSKNIILTFDVEEWYHTSFMGKYIPRELYNVKRIDTNINYPLELLEKYEIPSTFFVLGELAKTNKKIVKRIKEANGVHEIASHSFMHELIFEKSPKEIRKNIIDSQRILEDQSREKVEGFRAPYFSINNEAIEALNETGYKYDSSLHDFRLNPQYGHITLPMQSTPSPGVFTYKKVVEITVPVKRYFKFLKFPFGGGGYFRLYPLRLQLHWINSFLKSSDYFIMYMHPWEFDPEQPYIKEVPFIPRNRHYLGLKNQYSKVDALLGKLLKKGYKFTTVRDYLQEHSYFKQSSN